MKTNQINSFLSRAHQCAMAMIENSAYIERELPNVKLPSGLDVKAKQICADLVGAKQDMIHEIFELEEQLETSHQEDATIHRGIWRIIDGLSGPLREMHALVQTLQSASQNDQRFEEASVLIMEAATNIMIAYNATVDAAGRLEDDAKPMA